MIQYEIIPHIGVGPIRLGMTRQEVHAELGPPEFQSRDSREGFLDGFMVDFSTDGTVEFIELARSRRFRALFKGRCLHEMLADTAIKFVERYDQYQLDDPELGYSYLFINLQLSMWRPTVPGVGQPEEDPEGRYFQMIGIANEGYFT